MCRIRISVAHRCGYCSMVRSKVAGLDEATVADLLGERKRLSPREKAALEYADLFKAGDAPIDSDAVYDTLRRHFAEEEIIELGMLCAQTVGVGRFVLAQYPFLGRGLRAEPGAARGVRYPGADPDFEFGL